MTITIPDFEPLPNETGEQCAERLAAYNRVIRAARRWRRIAKGLRK